jgi:L-rhamnose isomerase
MVKFSDIESDLAEQAIELPSWAFGNAGTRFKVLALRAPLALRKRKSPTRPR